MIDPAFSLMRLSGHALCAATDDHVAAIDQLATDDTLFSLTWP